MLCSLIHHHPDVWLLSCVNITLLPTLELNVKHFRLVAYRCRSLETRDGKPKAQYNVFVWKAIVVMNVALAGRRCGGECHSGGRRREYDRMWAYGRTSVQKKQRCLRTRVGRLKENKRGGGGERDLVLSQGGPVTEQVNISLAFMCITF